MEKHGIARFKILGWDEKTWKGEPAATAPSPKMTESIVRYSYSGTVEGESELRYLMSYREADGGFVGMERVEGAVGGKKGSFVFIHTGVFDEHAVSGELTMLDGSGTGELAGITGRGRLRISGHAEYYEMDLSYSL